jgi:pyrimidine deaminase RibD-like protein
MGWELCKTVCGQTGHAEDVVLQDAGDDASGSTLYLIGHDTVCERCKELINSAGVAHLVIVG